MASPDPCPFCRVPVDAIALASDHAIAIPDGYPVAPGHTLVIPRRHVASVFDLTVEEWSDVWRLVSEVRRDVAEVRSADGVNVGVNDGAAAGQTVAHAHIHVIPRRHGDVPDTRGGVRWVIPAAADYWSGGPQP